MCVCIFEIYTYIYIHTYIFQLTIYATYTFSVGLNLCSPMWEKPSLGFGNPACTYCYPRGPSTGEGPQGLHPPEGRWPEAFPSCLCCLQVASACSTARALLQGLCGHTAHTHTKVYFHTLVGYAQLLGSISMPVDTEQCVEQSRQCCGPGGLGTNNNTDIHEPRDLCARL